MRGSSSEAVILVEPGEHPGFVRHGLTNDWEEPDMDLAYEPRSQSFNVNRHVKREPAIAMTTQVTTKVPRHATGSNRGFPALYKRGSKDKQQYTKEH